ncbi:chloroplast envelope quinone oxidoreductase homolog [Fagus crenata]
MAGRLMHAVQYHGYGGGTAGLKHVEVPVPTPKKDELLLKLEATSINPLDWKIQKGNARPFLPGKFPHIPGIDVAGEVVQVGPGVKSFKAGDKVVAVLSYADGGGLSEFAVAKERMTVGRPAEGAGLPIAGLTAHHVLTQSAGIKLDGSVQQKTNILITAASGGVGHYALGADEVLDYKTPEGAALKSPSGQKYDFVIHCATGIPWSTFEPNLSVNGKVIDLTPSPSAMMTFALKKLTFSKKQLLPVFASIKRENLDYLVKLVKEGKLKTVIDSKHPLSKAEDAWAKSIDGHATGKIIVES